MAAQEQDFIKLVCLPLKDLAVAIGVTYTAARNYSAGRPMPEKARARLARFARLHAKRLERRAQDLEE